jgi:hypothetical protein
MQVTLKCYILVSEGDGQPSITDQILKHAENMPYLPIDTAELGREEESLIRISSQSGESGDI